MIYCEMCGNIHALTSHGERLEKQVSFDRLRDADGRYHNEACALIESLAHFITAPSPGE